MSPPRASRSRRLIPLAFTIHRLTPLPLLALVARPALSSASLLRNLHMARSDALQGALPILVLKILARRGPLHGYAITTQIETASEVLRVEEGSLYPALHRLEESSLVKARWVVTANKRRARVYEVTEDGLRRLEREEQRWRTVTLAVGRLLEEI